MTNQDLSQLQSLPLNLKIAMTKQRIREWIREYGENGVYISFSGGKDSTVLLDIVRQDHPFCPAVFFDTGLEYPEVKEFVRTFENVEIIKPKMRFDQVIKRYGYPVIGKMQARGIRDLQHANKNNEATVKLRMTGIRKDGKKVKSMKLAEKWKYIKDAPFKVSEQCCEVMKKRPAKKYKKETGKVPIIATMAEESSLRKRQWLINGCNAFEKKDPSSQPLSFWTEQDVLQYIVEKNIPYSTIYGEIQKDENGRYYTTGESRTGCMFCMFGCHLESHPNRFERMKTTHPKQYNYCIHDLELGKVLDYMNVKY